MKKATSLGSWILVCLSLASHAQTPQPATSAATARITFAESIRPVPVSRPLLAPGTSATLVRSELTQAEIEAPVAFSVSLRMRNLDDLQARVSKGEIISFDDMAAKYYPTAADCKIVVDWLTAQGFAVKPLDKYNLSIFAAGSVGQSERAFGTKFGRVKLAGVESSSALIAPSLPATFAQSVLGINGLQPHLHPKTHFQIASGQAQKLINNQPPYTVKEIASAYNAAGVGVNGAGQKIAIVIDTFPASSDLVQFWQANGIAQSLNNIEEIQAVAGVLPGPTGEETLDVEWSSGTASGAKVRVYATTDLGFAHLDQAYQTILNDLPSQPALHQVSLSYGLGETYESLAQMQTDAQYFASIAAQGVTVLVSAGDGGSSPGTLGGWENNTGAVQVESPANDRNVTSVGGTSLYLNSATGAVSSESAWLYGGGGTSQVFARQNWQAGVAVPTGHYRTVPDVAFVADINTGGYLVLNGQVDVVGGTSWGAPAWAGFCAMINQARASISQPSLGLLGPKIYPLNSTSGFRQITTGTNGANGVYNAGPAYNLCTGLGVPNVAAIIQALAPAYPTPVQPVVTNFISYSGDFNGDGKQDILWRNTQTGEVDIWFISGASVVSQAYVGILGLEWKIAGIADFNGDGVSDIVWQNTVTGSFGIWIMHGSSYMGYGFASQGSQWSIAGVADLDHTGFADILWRNVESGDLVVWKSSPGLNFSSSYIGTASLDWRLAGAADLFGNGQMALIWRSLSSGEVVAWQLSNNSVSAESSLGVVPLDWTIAGTGNFNGDGHQDILWYSHSNGSVVAWMMNGFAVSPTWISQGSMSQDWQIRATPDVMGNGLNSILWSNIQTGEQVIWIIGGAGLSESVIGYAPPPWRVVR
jgi:kumamolisin